MHKYYLQDRKHSQSKCRSQNLHCICIKHLDIQIHKWQNIEYNSLSSNLRKIIKQYLLIFYSSFCYLIKVNNFAAQQQRNEIYFSEL